MEHLPLVDVPLPFNGSFVEKESEFFVYFLIFAQLLNFLDHLEADFFRTEAFLPSFEILAALAKGQGKSLGGVLLLIKILLSLLLW